MTYQLDNPQQLATPCLLVYPDIVAHNLAECVRIAGSVERLRPHVKTHKTPEIVQMELELGISKHKCATLSEARMLAECGVPDVLIAYPQVGPNIERLAGLVVEFPATQFSITTEDASNVAAIDAYFESKQLRLDVMVDLDVGMHRTGIQPGDAAAALYRAISTSRSLRPAGLHVYDGHNHLPDLAERTDSVHALMQPVRDLIEQLTRQGLQVPRVVCGGTPTFTIFAPMQIPGVLIELSPGTCVLSDHGYASAYRDMDGFRSAAVLMTRVVSKQHAGQLTLDLGHKAVAADPPAGKRCHFLGIPDAQELKQNEEHLVIQTSQAEQFALGDELYVLPTHICPTVALHSHMHVVSGGQIRGQWRVAARDRLY